MNITQKRLLIITCIFVVGLGIFFLRDIVSRFFTAESENPFSSIQEQELTAIQIEDGDITERLERQDNIWYVTEDESTFRADQGRVNTLINSFLGFEKETVVSDNPDRHQELGIENQKITFQTENDSYVLTIGDTTELSNNFIRVNDEEIVYTAAGFNQVFSRLDYRDLTIPFVESETDVRQITITNAGVPLEIMRQDNDWYIGQEKLSQNEMSFYLNELSIIRASEILDTDPVLEQGLFPESSITVIEGDLARIIEFYPKDETTKYAKRQNGTDVVYELTASLVENLIKSSDELIDNAEEEQAE